MPSTAPGCGAQRERTLKRKNDRDGERVRLDSLALDRVLERASRASLTRRTATGRAAAGRATAGRATAGPTATGPTAAAAEPGIGPLADEQPIQEQIDRSRHDLDGVERGIVERVLRALDRRERRRHAGRLELGEEVDARRERDRRVGRAVHEDRRR